MLLEGIQQMEFEAIMFIDTAAENFPVSQQRSGKITCFKCKEKCDCKKECPNLAGQSPAPDKKICQYNHTFSQQQWLT